MKLVRLLAITMILLNRKRIGAQELADRFEVSLRTIYRDMEAINAAGIPIVSYAGVDGGYEVMEQFRLDRQYLSPEEIQSILVALKGIHQSWEDESITSILDKVGALLTNSEQNSPHSFTQHVLIDHQAWSNRAEIKERLSDLRRAIQDSFLVTFSYTNTTGQEHTRTCEPMQLILKEQIWYMYGYCHLRENLRLFRLSRIRDLRVEQKTFARRPFTLEKLDFSIFPTENEQFFSLELRFHPQVKVRVMDQYQEEHIEIQPDGYLHVRVNHPNEPSLYHHLLSFGTNVTVLAPREVALQLRSTAQEIVHHYDHKLK
ncbi:YafY family protein [Mechercharimyces sp. CAU 1602]|uniref:helix-turn-helix transcriptional regulator n=1 Tax=Mechercharimyces sp. CAU 1602 TaxID=2973933 RepID=UPI002161928F|nr:YafY family protein [Mechercharimyces sp. CAU 1602]MCS1351484.1 YafY family transcriptional regulator [Mechercharimyces sp. CAU 1602]